MFSASSSSIAFCKLIKYSFLNDNDRAASNILKHLITFITKYLLLIIFDKEVVQVAVFELRKIP